MSEFTCGGCNADFDADKHAPRILPSCGHTFCSYCLTHWIKNQDGRIVCPEDKVNFILSDKSLGLASFPLNFSLISILRKGSENLPSQPSICQLHRKPLDMVCINDKTMICTDCALFDQHRGHVYRRDEDFLTDCRTALKNVRADRDFNCNKGLSESEKRVDLLTSQINEKQEAFEYQISQEIEATIRLVKQREQELKQLASEQFEKIKETIRSFKASLSSAKEKDDSILFQLKRLENALNLNPPQFKILLDGLHGENRIVKNMKEFTDRISQVDRESLSFFNNEMNNIHLIVNLKPVVESLNFALQIETKDQTKPSEAVQKNPQISCEPSSNVEKTAGSSSNQKALANSSKAARELEELDRSLKILDQSLSSGSESSERNEDPNSLNKPMVDSFDNSNLCSEYELNPKNSHSHRSNKGSAFASPEKTSLSKITEKFSIFDIQYKKSLMNPTNNILSGLELDLDTVEIRKKSNSSSGENNFNHSKSVKFLKNSSEFSNSPMMKKSLISKASMVEENFKMTTRTLEDNVFRKEMNNFSRASVNSDQQYPKFDRGMLDNRSSNNQKLSLPIEGRNAQSFAKNLEFIPQDVTELDLSGRKINDARLASFIGEILRNKRLKVLILDFNLISEIGFQLLIKKLTALATLEYISLVDNYLDESVFKFLKENSKMFKGLKRINLRENRQFKNITSLKKEVAALKKLGLIIDVSF